MVSKAKLYQQLDSLEAELKARLLTQLNRCVNGSNDLIFCVSAFNTFRKLKDNTDKQTEDLIEIGAHILSLRNKLDEPTAGTIAERICWYCREWSKQSSYQKTYGRALAQQFLEEIAHA